MSISTEGKTLGPDSAVSLVRKILDKIKYSKGFNLVTGYPTGGRSIPLPTASLQNWNAIGTLITIPETIYLKGKVNFRSLVAFYSDGGEVDIMLGLYRYNGESSGSPTCSLIMGTYIIPISEGGWLESPATVGEPIALYPGDTYYLVLFYNASGLGMLGNSGVLADSYPYLSFLTTDLGDLSSPPATLAIGTETVNHIYGSIYSVNEG